MKSKEVQNFIKQVDKIKNSNKLDLSIGEDLSIGLMNLISLEEHFLFSFIKTSDEKFLEFLEKTREMRKRLLAKIVKKDDDSEKWCISKHLLAASMRMTEVGTKHLHNGNKKEAKEFYFDAFNIYSMFWQINGFGNENILKNIETNEKKLSKTSNFLKKMLDCCRE